MTPVKWVDYSSDAAFCVDGNMVVTGWNAAAERLLGYAVKDAVGMKCAQILQGVYPTGEPLCTAMCTGKDCVTQGKKWGLDHCRLRHRDGQFVAASISSLVLPQEVRREDGAHSVAIFFLHEAADIPENSESEVPVRVFTLGRFALAGGTSGLYVEKWKRKQAVLVLKCLIAHLDRPVHRERLIEWLWPEIEPGIGWSRLKVAISALRSELRKGGVSGEIIETSGQSYVLRRTAVWVDFDVLETLVTEGRALLETGDVCGALLKLEDAVSLYRGELFEDEIFADWCLLERERLREVYLDLLSDLARCYTECGRYLEASRACRKALSTDPCRENFMRVLMESLSAMNRPDWARAQFISWRRTLEKEYELHPTQKTLDVFENLSGNGLSVAV